MRLQLLSDLHLETETWAPQAAPGAELLVLGGDIDATWAGYRLFADWPVPVLAVAGNHEFDGRDFDSAWVELRQHLAGFNITLLQRQSCVLTGQDGRRIRFVGTTRWSDFDLFGAAGRERALRSATYFMRLMAGTRAGQPFDAAAMREEGLACRSWLEQALAQPARDQWDSSVAITHFGPSLRSADPRYGAQPGTASFCNADDDLIPRADTWLHGHLHCRHDYSVSRAGRAPSRVVCQAAGLGSKGETQGWDALKLIEV